MEIKFCRDCANFEERRDIDSAALCKKNQGPYVCCEDFEPRDKDINGDRLYHRFCTECINFEDVDKTPICAKNYTSKFSCEEFTDRYEKLNTVRQNHLLETALLLHVINNGHHEPIPESLIKAGRRLILMKGV